MKRFKKFARRCPLFLMPLYFVFRIYHGFVTYCRLVRAHGIKTEWYSSFSTSSGDTYFALSAFHALSKKQGVQKRAKFLAMGQGQLQLASWFGLQKNVVVLSQREIHNLSRLQRFEMGHVNLSIHSMHCQPAQMYIQLNEYLLSYHDFDFLTMSLLAFGDVQREELDFPIISKSAVQAADKLFHLYRFKSGQTVVLAPYAYCIEPLSMTFWECLARELRKAGYSVCTNCANKRETPVPGTIGVTIPYEMANPFLEKAGYLIALRSGFVDVTSLANCSRVILYPKENYNMWGIGTPLQSFSLKKMGLQRNAVELEYDKNKTDEELVKLVCKR